MAKEKNKYLESAIPKFYRRNTLDLMIFTFIDTYKWLIPSVSVEEAAIAFKKRYKIQSTQMTDDAIIQSYYRSQKFLNDAEKT